MEDRSTRGGTRDQVRKRVGNRRGPSLEGREGERSGVEGAGSRLFVGVQRQGLSS